MNSCLNTQENGVRQRGIGTDSIFHIMELSTDYTLGLYKKVLRDDEVSSEHRRKYELLGKYADMHDLLESRVIEGIPFSEVIMDDYTELLGQD